MTSSSNPPDDDHRIAISNRFGTVTNRAVQYNVKQGLFGNSYQETLIMRHVVSARLETTRNLIFGTVLILLGIILFLIGSDSGIFFVLLSLVTIIVGAALALGRVLVGITASDGETRPSANWPWTRKEAQQFVDAVRKELLARG